ncbi:hypothetical protein BGZ59_011377, partial [Podila verticillata]
MESVWNNRKQNKSSDTSTGGSKLVQLQRQSSAIGSALSTSSSMTTTPSGSSTEQQQPGLSAFLTGSGDAVSTDPSDISSSHPGNGSETQPPATGDIHPLRFNWVFWFMHRSPGSKILNYESSMRKVATFGSIEDFWAVYSHLKRPHELPNVSDYHLFKQGVRPVWEDSININGGKWIVRLKKGLASRYWENL